MSGCDSQIGLTEPIPQTCVLTARIPSRPDRRLMDIGEIQRLDAVYLAHYRQALAVRDHEPLARHIHLPKLPEILSLSIAGQVALPLLGFEVTLALFPDYLQDGASRHIAVKSSWS